MAGTLSKQERRAVDDIFDKLDGNSDGLIGAPEIVFALRACIGNDVAETDVRDWLQLVCTDGSGEVGIEDFIQLLVSQDAPNPKVLEREVKDIFKVMDKEQDGKFSVEEIRQSADQASVALTDEQIGEILRECDVEKSGRVDSYALSEVMRTAWERTEELMMNDRLAEQAALDVQQQERDELAAKLSPVGEDAEALPEDEAEPLKKRLARLDKEMELTQVTRSIPRTAEGEGKGQLFARKALLQRCIDLYGMRDTVASMEDGEEKDKAAEGLAGEEEQVEALELEWDIPLMEEGEECTAAEARLQELKDKFAEAEAAAQEEAG